MPATGGGHELLVIEINWRRTQFAGDIADIDTNSRERKRLWPFIVWLFDSQVPLEPVFWPGKESGQQSGASRSPCVWQLMNFQVAASCQAAG